MPKNWNEIASRWTRFSRDVKKQWGELTDEEIMYVNGRRENLAGKIQQTYGITLEEADRQIDEWASKVKG